MGKLSELFLNSVEFNKLIYESILPAYAVNKNRQILYWNKAAEEFTGYKAEEVIGRFCFSDILDHRDFEGRKLCVEENGCPLVISVRERKNIEKFVLLRTKDGIRVPVHVKVVPVVVEEKAIGAVEFFDIEKDYHALSRLVDEFIRDTIYDKTLGVFNKHSILEEARKAISGKRNYDIDSSLLFIDVDNFKSVNDSLGHQAGDKVLRKISKTFLSGVRKNDSVGRFGGDEFLIVCYGASIDEAYRIAERLRIMVQTSRLIDNFSPITVSIGITDVKKEDTVESLIERADKAMYMSKEAGRNRTTILT